MTLFIKRPVYFSAFLVSLATATGAPPVDHWPEPTATQKPWTRWWWHGSAVEESELTAELEGFAASGIGGIEITPIYGVQGQEHRNIEFLSERWLAVVRHAAEEARRLGMEVDIVPGTGWRLGREDIAQDERAVELELEKRVEDGETVYTAISKESGERVKRPAPGGSGFTIDMLDREAVSHYLQDFNERFFEAVPAELIRAQFHDSWEYETDWSHDFLQEFERRRGYDLQPYLAALDRESGELDGETTERVRFDYRSTIEELILDNFCATWRQLTHERGLITRNQGHGTIANILDIYAQADIPETEIFREETDPLVHKFVSSAAHVSGRQLVSAESYTWLAEHWTTDLGKIKRYTDYLFICGVNHIFFHGTAYSPPDADWPGWVFYASTQLHDRNPIWRHMEVVNRYIARCQSFLQAGKPSDDVLLYWPISDVYSERPGRVFKFQISGDRWTAGEALKATAKDLWSEGFLFDYVSDRQLQQLSDAKQPAPNPAVRYRAVVLPELRRMPVATAEAILRLAESGMPVITQSDPSGWEVPGLNNAQYRQARLEEVTQALSENPNVFLGRGNSSGALRDHGVKPESFKSGGILQAVRRELDDGRVIYFIANRSDRPFDQKIEPAVDLPHAVFMDAWTGKQGTVERSASGGFRLQLDPYGSVLLALSSDPAANGLEAWTYTDRKASDAFDLGGPWTVSFLSGGPELPPKFELSRLDFLTNLQRPELERFAGVVAYETVFDLPANGGEAWTLDLGDVGSSARIYLNGEEVGVTVLAPHRIVLPSHLLKPKDNRLKVEVSTLAANRIRYLDQEGIPWRIFEDINFVNLDYRPFDASNWPLTPTGLKGPVSLIPTNME